METLAPVDASFLNMEDSSVPMHIGSICIFEGPALTLDELNAMVERKLPLVPRYRQKVTSVPLHLGRPAWVDDPQFRLAYHIRHAAIPAPGAEDQLRVFASRVLSQALDRRRPLWEMWLVEGLSGGRWALLTKIHHCLVDGVSANELLAVLIDDAADPPPATESTDLTETWHAPPAPTRARLLAHTLASRALDPRQFLGDALAFLRTPARIVEHLAAFSELCWATRPLQRSPLTGPLSRERRWCWARASLDDIRIVRSAFGGTVNDVVLTIVAGGLRTLLDARGESLDGRTVRTMIPISVRAPGSERDYSNQVAAVFAELPVRIADPTERLASIRARMEGVKASRQAVAATTLTSLSGFAPPLLLALGTRTALRATPPSFETYVTNVPGPQRPVFTAGRRLLEGFPFAPLPHSVRISIAVVSYDGLVRFGLVGDHESVADLDLLRDGIEGGLAELVGAADAERLVAC
jgi:WS/DGAT/MGAT family acyltransferase